MSTGISHKESALCYITKITMAAIENLFIYTAQYSTFIYTVLKALINGFFHDFIHTTCIIQVP